MVKFQTFFDWVFQINTLNKDQKRMFIDLIEKDLSGFGFKKTTKIFSGQRKYNKAIRFEKLTSDNAGQWIEFVFDKYGKQSFYINLGISELLPPNKHLWIGSVTRKKTQPHYWWGCRWNSIFRQQAWSRATKRVLLIVPQIVSELSNAKINDDVNHYIVLR